MADPNYTAEQVEMNRAKSELRGELDRKQARVAREVCEAEFSRFAETMELDLDVTAMGDEDKASLNQAKNTVLKAMMSGHLVIDEDGQPVYTPRVGITDPITFREPRGSTFMAGDGKKSSAQGAKFHAMLADQTQQPPSRFANMAGRDWKVCAALHALFMG